METQTHIGGGGGGGGVMAHAEIQEGRTGRQVDDMREEEKEFLKDLYVFMKKRDTPIERIPNLGFKQIDLYVMFKTVQDLGGYHQVTAQQLWKQVYNMLGGNPRSTSAATCTRRHYEKLLLPYECHVKGISMSVLSQPKHFHFASYGKHGDDGPRPPKCKRVLLPLSQSSHTNQPDRHGSGFPLPLQFPSFYHPSHTILPPNIPISTSTAAPPQFSFTPYPLNSTETVKEPLEHLRYLAERYKNSSGLTEPLNLSVKAPRQETSSNPVSSFAPPSTSKNPKFLNKPSPLYTPRGLQVVSRGERCETQDAEVGCRDAPNPNPSPEKARESYVIEVKAITASRSPASTLTHRPDAQNHPASPKDLAVQQREEREASPEVRELNLSRILPSVPRDNSGEMEIEIPLSVFQNWLRLCRSSGNKPHLPTMKDSAPASDVDVLPTDLTCHMNPQQLSSVAEDLRVRPRSLVTPASTQTASSHHQSMSQNPFAGYKPLPLSGILKNPASRDISPFDLRDAGRSYGGSKPPNCWDRDAPTQAPPIQARLDPNPASAPLNFASSKPYDEDPRQGGRKPEMTSSSAFLMMNSGSAPLLHLTTEEVMKLKKIISSSL